MRANPVVSERRARVREEAQAWLADMEARNLSPRTIRGGEAALLQLLKFLDGRESGLRLRDVREADLDAWRTSMFQANLSLHTIENLLEWAERYYRWMERRGHLFINPTENLEIPSFFRALLPVPSEADMENLLGSIPQRALCDVRDRALLELAYASGLRLSELTSLDVDSVDLAEGFVRSICKGRRERVVPLTKAAVAALRVYLEKSRPRLLRGRNEEPALWIAFKGGRRMGSAGLGQMLKERARDIGVKMSMHSVRRAFATHMLHHGATPMDLKLLLGHASFKHLRHYLRYAPVELIKTHRRSRLGR